MHLLNLNVPHILRTYIGNIKGLTKISVKMIRITITVSLMVLLVCVFSYHLLSPACGRRPLSGDYKTPSVRASVRASVRLSCFCINLNISFIYKDIFTKFAWNVYGYENLSLQNFSLIWKNKMAAIANCLKIVKVL